MAPEPNMKKEKKIITYYFVENTRKTQRSVKLSPCLLLIYINLLSVLLGSSDNTANPD